eukprot:COSAG01_NODE_3787_length_5693_cov_17.714337_4_plen_206_part_00
MQAAVRVVVRKRMVVVLGVRVMMRWGGASQHASSWWGLGVVEQFVEVTGSDAITAGSYLRQHDGALERAINSFFLAATAPPTAECSSSPCGGGGGGGGPGHGAAAEGAAAAAAAATTPAAAPPPQSSGAGALVVDPASCERNADIDTVRHLHCIDCTHTHTEREREREEWTIKIDYQFYTAISCVCTAMLRPCAPSIGSSGRYCR